MPAEDLKSIDEFLVAIAQCPTPELLFTTYASDMKTEGYDNVVFARLGPPDLRLHEVPYGRLPDGAANICFDEHKWEHDPMLAASRHAAVPFTWADEMDGREHTAWERRVMQTAAELGMRDGLTMPFHGPGGTWDVVNLSMRQKKVLDASRIAIVNLKTYATVQRYLVLTIGGKATGPWTGLAQPRTVPAPLPRRKHPQHGDCVGPISDTECRAIALVEIAARRYSAGLLDLNRRVPDIVGQKVLYQFMDRGLIQEVADDLRFHFVFRPSPVGRNHMRLCPCVTQWRREFRRKYIEKDERPED